MPDERRVDQAVAQGAGQPVPEGRCAAGRVLHAPAGRRDAAARATPLEGHRHGGPGAVPDLRAGAVRGVEPWPRAGAAVPAQSPQGRASRAHGQPTLHAGKCLQLRALSGAGSGRANPDPTHTSAAKSPKRGNFQPTPQPTRQRATPVMGQWVSGAPTHTPTHTPTHHPTNTQPTPQPNSKKRRIREGKKERSRCRGPCGSRRCSVCSGQGAAWAIGGRLHSQASRRGWVGRCSRSHRDSEAQGQPARVHRQNHQEPRT